MRARLLMFLALCAALISATTAQTARATETDLTAAARAATAAQFDIVHGLVAQAASEAAVEDKLVADEKTVVQADTVTADTATADTATADTATADTATADTSAAVPADAIVTSTDFESVTQDSEGPQTVAVSQQTGASDPVRLVIPQIALDLPLVSVGLDANNVPIVPNHDAAWYNLSARPGDGENVVFWGHVLRFRYAPDMPAPFARMKELQIGAPVTVYNANGVAYNYVISEQVWVQPHQVEYILPVGYERLTMVSCIGDYVIDDTGSVENMSHRLITIATPAE